MMMPVPVFKLSEIVGSGSKLFLAAARTDDHQGPRAEMPAKAALSLPENI